MALTERTDARVRYGRLVGLVLVAAGFVVIGIAWNGSASQACVDCQFPYLLSGGAAGLGLIVLGTALLVLAGLRAERMHLQAALEASGAASARGGGGGSTVTQVGHESSTSPNGRVVAGRSTYHRPDCRLVQGKTDVEMMSVEQASASGLTACRVCNPATSDRAETSR